MLTCLDWTTDFYADVAMMLSKCENVYSADVPSALQGLAQIIANSSKKDEFISKSPAVSYRFTLHVYLLEHCSPNNAILRCCVSSGHSLLIRHLLSCRSAAPLLGQSHSPDNT